MRSVVTDRGMLVLRQGQLDARKLIAGPVVAICDDCIDSAWDVEESRTWPYRLLTALARCTGLARARDVM